MTARVLIINGPNLNLLGSREVEVYGRQTLADIRAMVEEKAKALGLEVDFRHSNHEGELIDWVQAARGVSAGIIVNAGGLTHTSVALMDALLATGLPVVEVHLSNIYRREAFRHHSYVNQAARGTICGFGASGYVLALEAMAQLVRETA
ncbi:MAG: type II 3-dehydroquinate dehydratase [Alphaproteobacteria bacterium]